MWSFTACGAPQGPILYIRYQILAFNVNLMFSMLSKVATQALTSVIIDVQVIPVKMLMSDVCATVGAN